MIGNGLMNFFLSDFTILLDVVEIQETTATAVFYISLFNIIIGGMASILTFFFTLISFVANVKENSWEFGVLRAIGVKKVRLSI